MFRPSALAALTVVLALTAPVESSPQTTHRHNGSSRAVIGTIASYDKGSATLTVDAHSTRHAFVLGRETTVRRGSRVLAPGELSELTGSRVKVRYLVNGSRITVESVMVADGGERGTRGSAISGR